MTLVSFSFTTLRAAQSVRQRPTGSGWQGTLLAAGLALAVVSARAEPVDSPSFAYLLHCAGCHLEDGAGDPPEIPDLRVDLATLLQSQAGREYVVQVPGIADTPLPAEQMAALVNWMVGKFLPQQAEFHPFTAAEVESGRHNRLSDPVLRRRQLLAELTGSAETP